MSSMAAALCKVVDDNEKEILDQYRANGFVEVEDSDEEGMI